MVWLNEGTQVGKVAEIVADGKTSTQWGLNEDERGIFICFDLSGNALSNDVFSSEDQLEDEGVGLLSRVELGLVKDLLRKTDLNLAPPKGSLCALSKIFLNSRGGQFEHGWIVSIRIPKSTSVKEWIFSSDLSSLKEFNEDDTA